MTPTEIARLARTGGVAGLCPTTEANLGDGIFPGVNWIARYGLYGVGTDANVNTDAAQELRQLEYAQRLGQRGRNLMAGQPGASTGRALFNTALQGASIALNTVLPGLQAGASADLVTLQADHPSMVHRHGDPLLDGWMFGGGRGAIDCAWTCGRKRVTDGRHLAREAVAARYATAIQRLLAA